jgi:hypothetical protein
MARPWIRRIGTIAITVVAALAPLWAIWWLWSLLAPQWDPRTIIAFAIVATVLLAMVWWLWWHLPRRQVAKLALKIRDPKARTDVEDSFRKTVGQALGGAAVLVGAVIAYLQFTQQQQASHELLISNQVSKGFEQLASDKIAERLGGIYALEGVMNASDQYHQPVLEALCAFVRESTTRQKGPLTVLIEAFTAPLDGTAGKDPDKPPNDIQAALTVIGRRKAGPGRVALARAKISGADLVEANLSGAGLILANLSGAGLILANLSGANLILANLRDANLRDANLSDALLTGADLSYADLRGAKNLTQERLDQACGKPKALPPGLILDKPCPSRPAAL